jgi:cytidylate kinase
MIVAELEMRDHRDMTRDLGRLYPADDALIVNTGGKTVQEVLDECIAWCEKKGVGTRV